MSLSWKNDMNDTIRATEVTLLVFSNLTWPLLILCNRFTRWWNLTATLVFWSLMCTDTALWPTWKECHFQGRRARRRGKAEAASSGRWVVPSTLSNVLVPYAALIWVVLQHFFLLVFTIPVFLTPCFHKRC